MCRNYLISTSAPASFNLAAISSAVALSAPSFTGFGAPSTKSFASFNPKPVKSFTIFTTANLLAPPFFKITSKDVFAIADKKQQDDDDSYLDSVLPYAEVFFDQEIDFKEIMTEIENEISKDEVAEKIYFGERYDGLKRAQIIEENKMSEKEFNNGKRRMQTILDTVAKKYNIKKPVL